MKYIGDHPLASRHKLKAYYSFFSWQLSQIFPHEVVYNFVDNTKLVLKKGLTGATGNVYTGLHEFNDMGFVLHVLRPEDTFADIGANMGVYSILASGNAGAETYAFEPVPLTFKWLQKNIKINNLSDKVQAFNIGLGSLQSRMFFTSDLDTVNHVLAEHENLTIGDKIDVEINKFDEVIGPLKIPLAIKIDVEGFETEVINGMSDTLKSKSLKALIIELNGLGERYGFNEFEVHSKLLNHGFSPYLYDPFTRQLTQQSSFGLLNTIYVRDIEFVQSRLNTAPHFKVFSEWI
ncbi:FkbM family methyltransferase [soil metagenome]